MRCRAHKLYCDTCNLEIAYYLKYVTDNCQWRPTERIFEKVFKNPFVVPFHDLQVTISTRHDMTSVYIFIILFYANNCNQTNLHHLLWHILLFNKYKFLKITAFVVYFIFLFYVCTKNQKLIECFIANILHMSISLTICVLYLDLHIYGTFTYIGDTCYSCYLKFRARI